MFVVRASRLTKRRVAAFAIRPLASTGPQPKTGLEMTSGVMYNWRVVAVQNALAMRGKADGPLTIEDLVSLGHLDQYHYLGTEACDELIDMLGLSVGSQVLDVGAGIGGPARYISARSGCNITGIELQSDLTEAACQLTERVGLAGRVQFIAGDFADVCRAQGDKMLAQFDHAFSLLTFCHFPNRDDALKLMSECVKPGGTVLIEDLALVGPSFTAQETADLQNVVNAPTVTSIAEYVFALEKAGFIDIEAVELSAPWRDWTKARHESFRAAREETVRLHGEELFESRCRFYSVVADLFNGGNLGGVRITGRKASTAEARLRDGRKRDGHKGAGGDTRSSHVAVLNEMGSTVGATLEGAKAIAATSNLQVALPLYPAGPHIEEVQYHDSLQYHFFFPGLFIAGRVFHTRTLQQHSAWMYDTASGLMTELFEPSYQTMSQQFGNTSLCMESDHLQITDAPTGGTFVVKQRGLEVLFEQRNVFSWLPAGQVRDAVIHRPDLRCVVEVDGRRLEGTGYSKRYYGLYPRFWGYRFIHGITETAGSEPTCFWNADATFGDNKYNYFKVLPPSSPLISADGKDTWQQDNSGFALIAGKRYELNLKPLCTWETIIGRPGGSMESKMQNRYCEVEFVEGGKSSKGVAYNERCFGTLG